MKSNRPSATFYLQGDEPRRATIAALKFLIIKMICTVDRIVNCIS